MNSPTNSPAKSHSQIWDGFKIILASGLLWYALSQTDWMQIIGLMNHISVTWLILTLFLFFVMILLKAQQYNYATGGRVGYFRVLGIVIVQNALANFVATTAGVASYVAMMGTEKDVKFVKATLSFLIVKLADLSAVLMILVYSLVLSGSIPDSLEWVLLVAFALILPILFLFTAVIFRKRAAQLLRKIIYRLKIGHCAPVKQLMDMFTSLVEQDTSRIVKVLTISIGISLAYMLTTIFWVYTRLRTFSFVVDFSVVALITCFLQLASWVPIFVFGGLGISESISVYFFEAFGYDPFNVAAVLIVVRVLIYLMNALTLLYIPFERVLAGKRIISDT